MNPLSRRGLLAGAALVLLPAAWGCDGSSETIERPKGPLPEPTGSKVPPPKGKGNGAPAGGLEVMPRGPRGGGRPDS